MGDLIHVNFRRRVARVCDRCRVNPAPVGLCPECTEIMEQEQRLARELRAWRASHRSVCGEAVSTSEYLGCNRLTGEVFHGGVCALRRAAR